MSALLSVTALRVAYGGVTAVNDVDLTVGAGRVVGLIGPNGAGKTSTIDALTGYHAPAAGSVVFDGADITKLRAHQRARRGLVRTFQSVELFDDLTVEENLLVASERTGVLSAASTGPAPLPARRKPTRPRRTSTGRSSCAGCRTSPIACRPSSPHGRRKLVGVARALAQRPRVVLLDEPAAGLDHRREPGSSAGHLARSFPRRAWQCCSSTTTWAWWLSALRRDRGARLRVGDRAGNACADPRGRGGRRRVPRQPHRRGSACLTRRCWRSAGSPRATTARPSSATCASRSTRGRSSLCWDPTAPARRRRCRRSPVCCRGSRAR